MSLPRGIKNNNPLNIEFSKSNNWHGQLKYNKIIEPRFCRFSDTMWGYRCAAIILRKYINVYKCNTITKIVERWAPSTDNNNTKAYIATVVKLSDVAADTVIKFDDMVTMLRIMSAMTVVECGNNWDPQRNNNLWDGLYKGYMMARSNTTDFESIDDAK